MHSMRYCRSAFAPLAKRIANRQVQRLSLSTLSASTEPLRKGSSRPALRELKRVVPVQARYLSDVADDKIIYPRPQAVIGKPAPKFSGPAVVDGEVTNISLDDYKGKYVVFFFYPKDFTYVCPTEIIAFSDRAKEFEALNTQLIAASTDTEETHLAWIRTPRKQGGLGRMQIPILADTTKEIANKYGVLLPDVGVALRGLFIINREGVLEQITVNNLPVGRSVDETLRLIQAFQFVEEHGEVCPANWKPGGQTMKADPEDSQEYFGSGATEDPHAADETSALKAVRNEQEFNDAISQGTVVVDFMASWCGKCEQIRPFVEELADKHSNIKFIKVDTAEGAFGDLKDKLNLEALPAFHFYKDGKPVGEKITGYKKKLLKEAVERL